MKVHEFAQGYYSFYCKGCDHHHSYQTIQSGQDLVWLFNEDIDKPTFTPSLLNEAPNHTDPKQRRCHLNVTDGMIHYYSDCSHDMAGQTIPMDDIEL